MAQAGRTPESAKGGMVVVGGAAEGKRMLAKRHEMNKVIFGESNVPIVKLLSGAQGDQKRQY